MRSISILFLISLSSCSSGPVPMEYGKDQCEFCRMTLTDEKFGAEIITRTGKAYKFDDIRCFLNFYHQGEDPSSYEQLLVVDFYDPGKLISAKDAFYIKSSEIKSPMASQVAAFDSEKSMKKFKDQFGGIYMPWGEINTQFK